MENIQHIIDEAERRGWRPTRPPHLDMKVQGGWVVDGVGDRKKLKGGGLGWSYFGWVFDNQADANNLYNYFRNDKKRAADSKQRLDNFFSSNTF